jgi:hypothetical protein
VNNKCPTRRAKRKFRAAFVALGTVLCASLFAADEGGGKSAAKEKWFVAPVPTFMKPAVAWEIPGAKSTVLVPMLWNGDQMRELSVEEFALLDIDRAGIEKLAAANAAAALAKMKPEFTRNSKKVIEFAKLSSERPLAASAVWTPGFLKMFGETLGPKLIVVIPDRYTVFVFPALAGNCDDYAPMLLAACRATPYPASRELFEVGKDGVRAIGALHEP